MTAELKLILVTGFVSSVIERTFGLPVPPKNSQPVISITVSFDMLPLTGVAAVRTEGVNGMLISKGSDSTV